MRFVMPFLILCSALHAADNNIVVIFDTSSSMLESMEGGRSKIDTAKEVLLRELSKVPPSTEVAILTFNGFILDFGPVKRDQLSRAIGNAYAAGGTPLWQYMKIGADKLLAIRSKNNNSGMYKLLVVTDGEAGDSHLASDSGSRIGYLKDIMSRGIIIDVIGLSMARDHSLSTEINGSYMRGDDPNSIAKAVMKSVSEVSFNDYKSDDYESVMSLPDEFASGAVTGLSTFQNHPIGEAAKAVSGQSVNVSNPPVGITPMKFLVGFLGICVVCFGLIIFLGMING